MPKELTYTDAPAFLLMPDGNEYPEGHEPSEASGGKYFRRGVQVGWTRHQIVEIGVAQFDPSRELPTKGVFMSLDRAGINRLIRTLRKARDAAYGSDA